MEGDVLIYLCVYSAHGSLSLEGSDRPDLSREISPMYAPEGERLVTTKGSVCEAYECSYAYMLVCVCVCAGPWSPSLFPYCRISQRCRTSCMKQLQQILLSIDYEPNIYRYEPVETENTPMLMTVCVCVCL